MRTGELIVLDRADSLLEANPDSALHLLEAIDYNKLSREGQAHYGLLLTAARYKLYQTVDNMFINRSIDYYQNHQHSSHPLPPTPHLPNALYYKAVVLYELGKREETTLLLKQAEELAEQGNDELL